jgi:hypothetical protein
MSVLSTFEGVAGDLLSPITGPVGGVVSDIAGKTAGFVVQGISSWVLNGTKAGLLEVANAIGAVTAPNLSSTWFSSTYWRVAALAAMLTLPFLCAAAVQAIAQADLALLTRVTFGYLPLSILAVSLAAPMTMLLLAATDQMSAVVSANAAAGGARFLDHAAEVAGELATAAGGTPFFAVVVGLLALMAAMALAIELLVRAAAVYVVVLMLPLAFAAMVWPARRIWAVRLVELLAALILSKFAIVAVLSLASAAFAHGTPGIGELLVALSLIFFSTLAPWALMRILPFTELASGAAGVLRNELPHPQLRGAATGLAADAGAMAMDLPGRLREHARAMYARGGAEPDPPMAGAPAGESSAPATWESWTTPAGQALDSSDGGSPAQATWEPWTTPATGASTTAEAEPTAQSEPSATADTPFHLPAPWNGGPEVRLDSRLLNAETGSPADAPARTHPTPSAEPPGTAA